jgi:hypothetical protein
LVDGGDGWEDGDGGATMVRVREAVTVCLAASVTVSVVA